MKLLVNFEVRRICILWKDNQIWEEGDVKLDEPVKGDDGKYSKFVERKVKVSEKREVGSKLKTVHKTKVVRMVEDKSIGQAC